ncbi:MAG: PaaI family thioesterase [Alphaproteobacteria bacterium]|nr:PaaI family thioesterase [Alphaproteobacteria bacterium]
MTKKHDIPPGFVAYRREDGHEPFDEFVGPILIRKDAIEGEAVFGFQVVPHHTNMFGVVHGGMLATVVDTMMGYVVARAIPDDMACATITMTTDYISGATVGDWLEGKAWIIRRGRNIAFLRADMFAKGKPVIASSSSYAIIPRRQRG